MLFSLFLLLAAAAALAQRTADDERTGWYASNPWMLGLIALPLIAVIVIGGLLLVRRRKL